MSHFRIQRKLTEASGIKTRSTLPYPSRIKSLESHHSLSRSPKKSDEELRRLIKKISVRKLPVQQLSSKAMMQEGINAYKQKNVAKAVCLFKQARKNGHRSSQLSYYLGSCFLNQGKHQASIMHFNQCISVNPLYSPNTYLYISINFKLLGNLKQAIKILQQGQRLYPNFEEGQFYKAKLFMKMGETNRAIQSFSRCLQINSSNELAILLLGDCFKTVGKDDKALEKYKLLIRKYNKYTNLAGIRAATIMVDLMQFQEAFNLLYSLQQQGYESAEVNYLLGVVCCDMGRRQEGIVYLQSSLTQAKDNRLAEKSLKAIIKVCVQQRNFYEAEHQINRIAKCGFGQQYFLSWQLLVQGVNDLMKKKNEAAVQKLQRAVEYEKGRIDKLEKKQLQQFLKYAYIYLGYAYFLVHQLKQAISAYDNANFYDKNNTQVIYSKLLVEGLLLHQTSHYEGAVQKFIKAFQLKQLIEPLFMASICRVHQLKQSEDFKQFIFGAVEQYYQKSQSIQCRNPLFLFYRSLILLYQNKPCVSAIQRALQICEQPISQYYFIYALALYNAGKLSDSLEAISKAIEIDPGIQEFYRQRSKYYFIAQDYDSAIYDCRKAENLAPYDEEVPLLMSFYCYLQDQFQLAYKYLQTINPSTGKIHQFQLALHLRLGMYQKLQSIGAYLMALRDEKPINQIYFTDLQRFIDERYQYSEFSVYFYHLILSVGYSRINNYEKGLSHLFGCLEEIQLLIDQKEQKESSFDVTWEQTELMLDEIKFNIVIMTLLKANLTQAQHFITVFTNQKASQDLKNTLATFLQIIKDTKSTQNIKIIIDSEEEKISDNFPVITFAINQQTLTTKFLISYPVKLKFTIAPQFDPSYLLNFDIDKVQYKLPPPWLKAPTHQVKFTNSICQASILLSQSRVTEKQQQRSEESSKGHFLSNLRLDKALQAKLQRLIKK